MAKGKEVTDTDIRVDLDTKTRAFRTGSRWIVQKRRPNGSWDMVADWVGGRRSLLQWCEANGVYPSRTAEAQLAALPEGVGFRER